MKQCFILVTLLTLLRTPAEALYQDPIKTESGLIIGLKVGDKQDVRVYRGISFAAPPVGELRWKPPQRVKR